MSRNSSSALILATPFLLVLLLAGCGSRQAGTDISQPAPREEAAAVHTDEDLSHAELMALKTTGHIDRDVPDEAMADVRKEYKFFLREGRKTMTSFSRRSEQYLAYARRVFRDRGMPEELANLAIVESGYRPNAISSAGAAGAWQFMPETGQRYGLSQDKWLDERLDPYRSTEAAAAYLQKLYNDFGDWPTAIAAYNAGEGKISRAKDGTGGKDFFEVKAMNERLDEKARLREETKQYVPRFMAVTKIMRNLPELGFAPIEPEKSPSVHRLTVRPGTDLAEFSRACNMSWAEFNAYNRHHKRNITCTDRCTFVYVPDKARDLASRYLCSDKSPSYAGWKLVAAPRGLDSLEKISRSASIPLEKLKAANPGLGRLRAGQMILAPSPLNMKAGLLAAVVRRSGPAQGTAAGKHVLAPNETLFAVARKYNVSVEELKKGNGIVNPGTLKAGLVLNVPPKAAKKEDSGEAPLKGGSSGSIGKKSAPKTYTVQSRDSLWNIARKHNISVADLKRWNRIDEKKLKPGVSLIVSAQ